MADESDFLKPYNPEETEKRIYAKWLESGYFTPENLPPFAKASEGKPVKRTEPFTIIMPPPNATGTLHLGHALEYSFQDAVIRFKRMQGMKTLWLPGTDHAAIATNTKVEKILIKKEGKNRHDIGRETFVKKVEDFVAASRGTMQEQIRLLGASVDWSREAFTLDAPRSMAVKTAFKNMYDAELIYRGYRVINWDPKGQTSVSDDEVEHKTEKGTLYIFRYSSEFPIPIATTRPETKVGDTAVAVHPEDKRYQQYIGKTYAIEFAGTTLDIIVIADESIDPQFGTGAVGVTPAHSLVDAEIAQQHELPMIQVINEQGHMTEKAGPLVANKKTKEAREIIIQWLKEQHLLEKEESIELNISVAERSGGVIEPLPKLQWFITVHKEFAIKKSSIIGIESSSTTTLKEIMRKSVENGQIQIMPDRFEKIYFNWINNLRDWNISRQIWYGHRIPVWYCVACGTSAKSEQEMKKCTEPIVSTEDVAACPHCGGVVQQDLDTLDTWFSSAIWTFSTLGWPDENASDLKTYHPTSFMNPGYEILFFWVARMILMSGFLLGEIPFKIVYLHGMLRDSQGRKFSKSLDNGIDPLDVINQNGTDALRMSLIVGIGPGNDSNFDLNKVKAYKHFANKIWNASRFVISNTEDFDFQSKPELAKHDQAILQELTALSQEVTRDIEEYKLYLAAEKLYHYFWHTFADTIIEEAKSRLKSTDVSNKASAQRMLYEVLTTLLKLLHPFMPFVTEAVWEQMPHQTESLLMIASWPQLNSSNNKTES
ncbi:MAG: Uncharacterized protein G01um101470_451 [Parcubacteria group bacterium Gr01-1014_70]|nr:MAG: Uncharacterized protein G01um101470_451 [Parcubacteria group bacterium Gr01-1014_70]